MRPKNITNWWQCLWCCHHGESSHKIHLMKADWVQDGRQPSNQANRFGLLSPPVPYYRKITIACDLNYRTYPWALSFNPTVQLMCQSVCTWAFWALCFNATVQLMCQSVCTWAFWALSFNATVQLMCQSVCTWAFCRTLFTSTTRRRALFNFLRYGSRSRLEPCCCCSSKMRFKSATHSDMQQIITQQTLLSTGWHKNKTTVHCYPRKVHKAVSNTLVGYNDNTITRQLLSLNVKEHWKSVSSLQICVQEHSGIIFNSMWPMGANFLDHPVHSTHKQTHTP